MVKNILLQLIVFVGILSIVYVLFALLYYDNIDNIQYMTIYYSTIFSIVYLINNIKRKYLKWGILGTLIISFTYIIFSGRNYPDINTLYLLIVAAPINIPFIKPGYFKANSGDVVIYLDYFLFFVLPLIYWILVFRLAKYIKSQDGFQKIICFLVRRIKVIIILGLTITLFIILYSSNNLYIGLIDVRGYKHNIKYTNDSIPQLITISGVDTQTYNWEIDLKTDAAKEISPKEYRSLDINTLYKVMLNYSSYSDVCQVNKSNKYIIYNSKDKIYKIPIRSISEVHYD